MQASYGTSDTILIYEGWSKGFHWLRYPMGYAPSPPSSNTCRRYSWIPIRPDLPMYMPLVDSSTESDFGGNPIYPGGHQRLLPWNHQVHIGDRDTQPKEDQGRLVRHKLQIYLRKLIPDRFSGGTIGGTGLVPKGGRHLDQQRLPPDQGGNHPHPYVVQRLSTVTPIGLAVTATYH